MLLIKKSVFTSIFIFFFFIPPTLADTLNQERKFNIYAKLSLVPKIKIMEISTLLNVENETFHYEFIINSKNIVEFINQIDGKGKVEGFVNNLYQPTKYTYKYIRKKKEKYVEIDYDDNKVVKIINVPEFDSSKLSVVNDEMLIDTIDPSSFFLNVLDFNKTESCKNKFKIFDGKRRYDVVFNNLTKNTDNGTIECEAKQIRIGGYKKEEKVNDVFAASDYIKVIYKDDKLNSFVGYEAKNGSIKIIINEAS